MIDSLFVSIALFFLIVCVVGLWALCGSIQADQDYLRRERERRRDQ